MPTKGSGALSHLRVVDLTRVLAGPQATQIFADLGATVIKIERPGTGDDTRQWAPPFLNPEAPPDERESAYFASINRGKQSVAVDIATPQGQEVVRRLVADADVLIENYKVGALAKYGLDHESLSTRHPRLVYCSITGFGQTGPYRDRPGYDPIMQAMGGLMDLTGDRDGPPQRVGLSVTDVMAGLYSAIGVLAALAERERSGLGQHVDMALFDGQIAALAPLAAGYFATGVVPRRSGNAHGTVVPSGAFECRDGPLQLMSGNDGQFRGLARGLGLPELAGDVRFATGAARVANKDALNALLSGRLAERTRGEWVEVLNALGVPCGPINTLAEVFDDPQTKAREMVRTVNHPVIGEVRVVGNPLRLSRTPVEYSAAAPTLGAHTAAVLGRLGYSGGEIEALRGEGII